MSVKIKTARIYILEMNGNFRKKNRHFFGDVSHVQHFWRRLIGVQVFLAPNFGTNTVGTGIYWHKIFAKKSKLIKSLKIL